MPPPVPAEDDVEAVQAAVQEALAAAELAEKEVAEEKKAAAAKAAAAELHQGATCAIEGLVSRADLNGKLVKLLKFSDGRWGTRFLDDSEDPIRLKPTNLVPIGIGLAIVKNGMPYVQQAWWFDEAVEQSTRTVANFKAAFIRGATDLGLSPEELAAEQQIFDVPFIFTLGGGSLRDATLSMPPAVQFLCNVMRIGVSSLSPDRLNVIIQVANKMNELGQDMMEERAVERTLRPLGFPVRDEENLILMVALNLPAMCDAYVYSTTADTVVAWRRSLKLDLVKLDRACKTVIVDAPEKQRCTSRSVCFYCGTSPISQGVSLSLCPSCECVAYCCDEHRKFDRMIAHESECGCKKPFPAPDTGIVVTPCRQLCITRLATEVMKEESQKMEISTPPASGLRIVRSCVQGRGMQGGAPLPMGWEVGDAEA